MTPTRTLASALAMFLLIFLPSARAQTFLDVALFPAGARPIGIVSTDFNRDGKPDVAVANYDSANISVLLGKGDELSRRMWTTRRRHSNSANGG